MSGRYSRHKYVWSRPHGSVHHQWQLVGPRGGLHFHVSVSAEYGDSVGIEFHFATPPDYMADQAPSECACWLIGGRCWSDGTSLYAKERLWPLIEPLLQGGDHDAIFRILENEADQRFPAPINEPADA